MGHKALSNEITTQAQPHHTTTVFNSGTCPAALVPYDTSYGLPHRITSVVSWWCWGKVSSPTTHAMPLPCTAVSQTGTECDLQPGAMDTTIYRYWSAPLGAVVVLVVR